MARILLVEDNEMNRDMLRRRLERHAHSVILATNGQEALELTRAHRPDIVLMDLGLPIVDGWTVIRILKGDAATHAIPIIALTGHVMATDEMRAFESGCDAFHPKPVDMPALLSEITRLTPPPPATLTVTPT
ncbi:MAG: response regulator [Lentisphaerae bacterium]|nr:response regulator [Lentisphaerota bacterium]